LNAHGEREIERGPVGAAPDFDYHWSQPRRRGVLRVDSLGDKREHCCGEDQYATVPEVHPSIYRVGLARSTSSAC
jgi:hypothetical protein